MVFSGRVPGGVALSIDSVVYRSSGRTVVGAFLYPAGSTDHLQAPFCLQVYKAAASSRLREAHNLPEPGTGRRVAWECVRLASSVLETVSWMFQTRRSWKGQNADLPVCKETTPRPNPGPRSQLLGSSSFESSLCLSCCVFPPDELVQPWPRSQTYHPTERFEPRPVFLQLVFMELV